MIASIQDLDPETWLIIACDKLDNLRSTVYAYGRVGEEIWKRFSGGRDGTLWYYHRMIVALRNAGKCPLLAELEVTLARLETMIIDERETPK
jgi:GTP pyrophosphokinase